LSTTVSVPGLTSGGGVRRVTASLLGPIALTVIATVALLAILASSAQAKEVHLFESQITEANGTALTTPFGLATDGSNNVWLTDTGGPVVDKFDPGGAFLAQGAGGGHFSSNIQSLAFSTAAEHAFVADSNEDDLWVLNSDTSYLEPGGKESIKGPWGSGCCFLRTAADNYAGEGAGDLYVSSGGENTITRIDAKESAEKGEAVPAPFSGTGPFIGGEHGEQLVGPFSGARSLQLAVAPNGNLYVASTFFAGSSPSVIYEFEPSGELVTEISTVGGEPLGIVRGLAVDPTSGNLLVVVAPTEHGAGTIVELTASGGFIGRITEADGAAFGEIQGLATDSTGRLYAADATNHVVDVFGPLVSLPVEVEQQSVAEVASTSATLKATIAPNGIHTSYYFEYGTSPCSSGPGACAKVPAAPVDLGSPEVAVNVAQHITGLQPGTGYFYRVVSIDDETAAQIDGSDATFTTQSAGPFALPDGRQWELVSPPDKHGGKVEGIPERGAIRAAADGEAITYLANAPTESGAQGSSSGGAPGLQVLSTRDGNTWTSRDIPSPNEAATGFSIGQGPEYRFFDENLSMGLLQPFGRFNPNLSSAASEQTPYIRTLGSCGSSCYLPLVSGAPGHENVPPGTHFGEERACEEESGLSAKAASICGPFVIAATEDLRHVVISSPAELTPNAGQEQLYEWSGGQLSLISVLPPDEAGLELPAPAGSVRLGAKLTTEEFGNVGANARRAVSADGARVFWESGKALYVRDTAKGESLQVDASEIGCPESECESGDGRFQIASTDGSRVLFTDSRRLTTDSGSSTTGAERRDLYECRIVEADGKLSCDLSDLTPSVAGESANVQGNILGAGEDGSTIYFVADGTLGTGPNKSRESARPGQPNLFEHKEGANSFVATLSQGDNFDWNETAAAQPVRVSPDGQWLSFMSERPLTGYNNRDAVSGNADAEVYLYDADTGGLVCASCDPTGAQPVGVEYVDLLTSGERLLHGSGQWPGEGWVAALPPIMTEYAQSKSAYYEARYLSNSGRLFFNTLGALVPQDTNGNWDVYEYEPPLDPGQPPSNSCATSSSTFSRLSQGCVGLISSGTSKNGSAFLDASESGNDVFFLTAAKLVPEDVDSAYDVYDAHVCSAAVPCPPAPEPPQPACSGDACQQPATPPVDATPGSLTFNGAGNVLQCPKGKVKQKGRCIKKKPHKAKKHKKKQPKKDNGKKQKKSAKGKGGRSK
jgi:hypothetical protein